MKQLRAGSVVEPVPRSRANGFSGYFGVRGTVLSGAYTILLGSGFALQDGVSQ